MYVNVEITELRKLIFIVFFTFYTETPGCVNVMYVCTKRVCKALKVYTVHKNLGEYNGSLLIVYLKMSLIYMQYIIYIFKSTLKANFLCKRI